MANKLDELFEHYNEEDLDLILKQVARRMLVLRRKSKDVVFWNETLIRIGKWLSNVPRVNKEEEDLIRNPPQGTNGYVQVIRHLRLRTGMRLKEAKEVVDVWLSANNIKLKLTPIVITCPKCQRKASSVNPAANTVLCAANHMETFGFELGKTYEWANFKPKRFVGGDVWWENE